MSPLVSMQMLRREVHSFELSVCVPDTTAAPTVIITGGNLTFREDKKKSPERNHRFGTTRG